MEKQYESLSTYLMLAKKVINKSAPKFLIKEMLNNEDAISDVATAIMIADQKFNPSVVGSNGQKKTKYSYRNQCGIWAIKTYITKKYKNKKINSLNFTIDENNQALYSVIADKSNRDPLEIIIEDEEKNNIHNDIEFILNSDIVNEKQKEQIKMYYYENKSLAEIGEGFGVTREAVRQNIKRAIENIQQLLS